MTLNCLPLDILVFIFSFIAYPKNSSLNTLKQFRFLLPLVHTNKLTHQICETLIRDIKKIDPYYFPLAKFITREENYFIFFKKPRSIKKVQREKISIQTLLCYEEKKKHHGQGTDKVYKHLLKLEKLYGPHLFLSKYNYFRMIISVDRQGPKNFQIEKKFFYVD